MYDRAVAELTGRLDGLGAAAEAAGRAERATPVDPSGAARGLVEGWHVLPVEARREALRALIRRVLVTTGRPCATVVVVPVWDDEQ